METKDMSNTNNGCGSGNCACKSAASVQKGDPFDFTDYGTPLRHADIDVTLEIDGEAVTVPAGTSVMRAAMKPASNVPKLCATGFARTVRLVPPVPRARSKASKRLSRVVHDAGRSGHEGAHAKRHACSRCART